jgi:mono/diheme cytochrome c family protein
MSRLQSTSRLRRGIVAAAAAVVLLGTSTVALGLPWDVDMVDSVMVKGYERAMPGLPAGVVAQPNLASPKGFVPNLKRESAEGQALQNPLPDDEATRARGKVMMETYCAPCHGADGVNLGPVAAPGRVPGVVPLAGPAGISKLRSDGWIYLTIRNGGPIMPAYSWAMTDAEMWSIVTYLRTLPNAQQTPPVTP